MFNFFAGGLAGALSCVATQPFYVAKTRIQQSESADEAIKSGGVLSQMADIVEQDGFKGLWAGALPVLLFGFFESALQLSSHDWAVDALGGNGAEANLPLLLQILAAGAAAIPSVLATNPMEVLAIFASSNHTRSDMMSNAQALGIDTLYDGFATTWLRDVPFLGMYFPTFVYLSAHLSPALASGSLSAEAAAASSTLIAGTAAGIVASALTTPVDVINVAVKTRLLHDAVAHSEETQVLFGSRAKPLAPALASTARKAEDAYAPASGPAAQGDSCWNIRNMGSTPSEVDSQRLTLTTAFSKRSTRARRRRGGVGVGAQASMVAEAVAELHARGGAGTFMSGMTARVAGVMPAQCLTMSLYEMLHWLFELGNVVA